MSSRSAASNSLSTAALNGSLSLYHSSTRIDRTSSEAIRTLSIASCLARSHADRSMMHSLSTELR